MRCSMTNTIFLDRFNELRETVVVLGDDAIDIVCSCLFMQNQSRPENSSVKRSNRYSDLRPNKNSSNNQDLSAQQKTSKATTPHRSEKQHHKTQNERNQLTHVSTTIYSNDHLLQQALLIPPPSAQSTSPKFSTRFHIISPPSFSLCRTIGESVSTTNIVTNIITNTTTIL